MRYVKYTFTLQTTKIKDHAYFLNSIHGYFYFVTKNEYVCLIQH